MKSPAAKPIDPVAFRDLCADGLSSAAIARRLGVPPKRVRRLRQAEPLPAAGSAAREPVLGVTVFTTGRVAELCAVSSRTATKWFDSGALKGYRIPGSRDRRIPAAALRGFMLEHGIPLPPELSLTVRVGVALLASDALPPGFVLIDVFRAGGVVASAPVAAALVGDAEGLAVAVRVATTIQTMHPGAAVALVVSEDVPDPVPGWGGRVLRRPCDLSTVEGA